MSRYAVVLVAFFVLVAPARGAGGPLPGGDAGPSGVTAPGLADRYVTRAVPGGTLVLQVERRGGAIIGSRLLRDRLFVPVVAYDGSATGLSADGRTLVLAGARHFAVLDTETLSVHQTVALPGRFALDAVSPDGRTLYLIQTLSRDGTRYAVRAYDLDARRLRPEPIVDPTEPDEPMAGSPMTRVMSRDGRWAYTLYDRGEKAPFVHALDTERGRARCIDLDGLGGAGVGGLRLAGDGALVVRSPEGRRLVSIDPRTLAVRAPARPAAPAADTASSDWVAPAIGLVALVLLAFGAVRLGRAGTPANTRL